MQRDVIEYANRGRDSIPEEKKLLANEMDDIYRLSQRETTGDTLFYAIEAAFHFGYEVGREAKHEER